MTTQPLTLTEQRCSHGSSGPVFGFLAQWTLVNGDDGEVTSANLIPWLDRTFQVDGTFAGATVVIEGSNDGVNYYTLTDPQGVPLSFTSADIKQVLEVVMGMRPRVSGGTGATAINVTGFFRRTFQT